LQPWYTSYPWAPTLAEALRRPNIKRKSGTSIDWLLTKIGQKLRTPTYWQMGSISPGLSDGCPESPPAQAIDLSASGYKVKGRQAVSLTWSGTEVAQIGIYRDGAPLVGPVPNTGSYTDNINSKGGGSYVYEVCEAGTSTCSNVASVIF
jgi:hypothetical protein